MKSLDVYVLLNPNAKSSPQAVIADIAATFPSAPAVTLSRNPSTSAPQFQLGNVVVEASILPKPLATDRFEPAFHYSWLWPNAKDELRSHASMVTLKVSGGDAILDQLVPLTMVTAAVIGACPQALGVFWHPAIHFVKGNVFREFAAKQLPNKLPLLLWIGMMAVKDEDGASSGFTIGMHQFGHPEIETKHAPVAVPDLRQRFNDLADHLIKGVQIPEGAVIGQSATQKISVSYGESQCGLNGRVMRLHHQRV